MRLLKLVRVGGDKATTGVLLASDRPVCVTMENPWWNNQRSVSCIPFGIYQCQRIISPRFGETFEVKDVHDRSHIIFHKGNHVDDTRGCILLGSYFDEVNNEVWIKNSSAAFKKFMDLLEGEDVFNLEIYPKR